MHVLVTGGAGFLGSHLAAALLARGDEVEALDDLSTGRAGNLPAGAVLVEADLRDRERVREAVSRADLVLHFGAAVGAEVVARDPAGTWSRNVEGTAALLDAAARHGRRVLLASSSEVYGPEGGGPLREDDPVRLRPHGRRDVYALSKAAGEAYALALHRSHLLPVTVVRLFNVVGARQSDRYGMVLPRFVAAARAGRPLEVYGDGSQRRCFLHVGDAVRALLALAGTAASEGVIVNVGTDREIPIRELAETVAEEVGGGARIRHVPFERVYGEGFCDPPRRVPDVSRLGALTGFAPRLGVRDAIADLLAAASPASGA
jgi:UDP-glucose 4-epimerase